MFSHTDLQISVSWFERGGCELLTGFSVADVIEPAADWSVSCCWCSCSASWVVSWALRWVFVQLVLCVSGAQTHTHTHTHSVLCVCSWWGLMADFIQHERVFWCFSFFTDSVSHSLRLHTRLSQSDTHCLLSERIHFFYFLIAAPSETCS